MDNAALFSGDIYIYWHGIFMGISILLAVLAALIFCAALQNHKTSSLLTTILLSMPLGIISARALYCISNYEEFKALIDIFSMTDGGYALYGGIFGVFLAAVIMRIFNSNYSISANCDCMALGGSLGIAVGRMASYFSFDNIGIVMTNKNYCFFPLAVYDSAADEWVLATFTMESVVELIIFIILCVAFIKNNNEKKGFRGHSGDIALLFLMLHGAAEAVFDSMHMDALRFPGNSFVRMQQIIGAVCFAAVMVVFLVRSIKKHHKFKLYHFILTALTAVMIAIAVYMEFDRISDTNYFCNHGIMFAALLCGVIMCMVMYKTTLKKTKAEN